MIIATLGPKGTYSEEACIKYNKDAKLLYCPFIGEVFTAVNKSRADIGIVPIENSLNGSVYETLDSLYSNNLRIMDELNLEIKHSLLSKSKNFTKILSHPQAIGQCTKFLRKFKNVEVEPVGSTAKAAEMASKDESLAAIGNELLAKVYGLKLIYRNILDSDINQTKFIVISKNKRPENIKGKKYRTYIAIFTKVDRPGLLFDVLSVFRLMNINLTKIESRPSKIKMGQYIFYIEFEGNEMSLDIKKVLEHLKRIVSEVKIFGSYPVAK